MNEQLPVLINELSPETIQANFVEMETRSKRAEAALKSISDISDDETDAKAEQLLVKVRKTFEYVEGLRKGMTGPLDDIKKLLMEPEKLITNAAGSGNEYERVKKLRDTYANKKYQQERERQAAIEKKRRIEAEIAKVRGAVKASYTEGPAKANMALNAKLADAFKTTTLETLPKLKNRMSKGTKLSEQVYNDWFDPNTITSTLPYEDIKKICEEEKASYTYEQASKDYLNIAQATFDYWMDRLPELEKSLQEGSDGALKLTERAEKEEAERNAKALAEAQEAARNSAKAEELQAEFKAQIELQTGAIEPKGRVKKRAIIEADAQDLVSVTAELFFNVFIHPKYPGIIKKNRKGEAQFNEDGTPIYVDWFQNLLDFYANNCDEPIPGIKIIEEVVTTQRAK